MGRNRGLFILAGVTLIVAIAAGWSLSERYTTAALEQKEGGLVFPNLQQQVGAISTVEVTRGKSAWSLDRQPDGWANMGAGGFPARQARIEKMIGGLAALSYFEPKTARTELYPKIQVEDVAEGTKSTRLTVKDDSGKILADVIVGKAKTGVAGLDRDGVYIRLPKEERAWLAEGTLDVRYDDVDWSERGILDVRSGSVGVMNVTNTFGETIEVYRKNTDDADLTLKNLPENAEIDSQYQIDYMAGLLDNVTFSDAKRADEIDFAQKGGFSATVVSTDGLVVMIRTAAPEEDSSIWAQFDADVAKEFEPTEDAKKEAERIKSTFADWAFRLPRAKTERLKIQLKDIIKIKDGADRKEG